MESKLIFLDLELRSKYGKVCQNDKKSLYWNALKNTIGKVYVIPNAEF